MTYYIKENNTLRKCGSVVKIDGRWVTNPTAEQAAKIGAFPRSEESFAPPSCDEGFHAVPDGYDSSTGKWVKKWRIEELPPPLPRTFSKLKITTALMKIEKWLPVRDYLVQSGMYDLYLAAQDFKEDDEFFIKGLSELKAKFGMSEEEIEAILKQAEV